MFKNKNVRYMLIFLIIVLNICTLTSCSEAPITYTYDELNINLLKVEIINCSVSYEPEYQNQIEVIKILNSEECDYAITEISNMEFERKRMIMSPSWPRENVLVFYYSTYELWFYSGRVYKASEESETGVVSYHVYTEELEELIDHLLNN